MCSDQLGVGGGVVEGSSDEHGNDDEVWSNNNSLGNNNDVVWRNDNNNSVVDEAGHFSSPEEFQNPPSFHLHQPFVDDVGFGYQSRVKKVKFSHPDFEEEEIDTSEESSSLGLTLHKSPSLIDLVERKLSEGRLSSSSTPTRGDSGRSEDYGSQPMSEKMKAASFHALLLRIGSWERISKHEGDLVAKCYFAKRKLVWEILEGPLKSKMEIQWTEIVGIKATIAEDEPGLLEIELDKAPTFATEVNPQPRKHTMWHPTDDFTEGHASRYRIHHVRFAPGVLDKPFEKLLHCHPKLKELIQEPFPSKPNPYFEKNPYGIPDFDFNGFGTPYFRGVPYFNFSQPLRIFDSNSQMSANDKVMNNGRRIYWGETSRDIQRPNIQASRPTVVLPSTQVNLNFSNNVVTHGIPNHNVGSLSYIENHLLADNNPIFSDENNLLTQQIMAMQPLLQMMNSRIGEEQVIPDVDDDAASASASGSTSHWDFGQEMMMQQAPIHNPPAATAASISSTYTYPLHAYNMHEGFSNFNSNHNL